MTRLQSTYIPAWPPLDPRCLLPGSASFDLPFPFNAGHKTYFSRASHAIYHLLLALRLGKDDVVLVPDYHSGNEVLAIRGAGATIRYYSIHRDWKPDLEELRRLCLEGARVLYVIHYAGWPLPMREIEALCEEFDLLLIEDCALSMLSEVNGRPLGSFGDYSIFCLYKTLPVPNGGLLVQNRRILRALEELPTTPFNPMTAAGRSAELILEWIRSRANLAGKSLHLLKRSIGALLSKFKPEEVPIGKIGFDVARASCAISPTALRLLSRFDYAEICRKRRENYRLLWTSLEGLAPLMHGAALADGVIPLFFPLLVPDKHAAAEKLRRLGVCAIEFWNYGDSQAPANREASYLRDHLLELPIHQGVTFDKVRFIAREVLRERLHF